MPKMVQFDSSLKCFSDPAFLVSLRKAQIAAACSERESDYDLLSDLLIHRVEQDSDRSRRLGIVKAIEVVDQIDARALIALSMVYAISKYVPTSLIFDEGLNVLNTLYGKILSGKQLPVEESWIEHLDLLSAVRINERGLHHFKKLEEYVPGQMKPYFETGILEDSDEFRLIQKRFIDANLPNNCFIPHPLKQGFVFLKTSREIEQLGIVNTINGKSVRKPLNDEQKAIFRDIVSLACKDGSGETTLVSSFWQKWDSFRYLNTVHEWWNSLTETFSITPLGVALANAYIHGKDPSVPCLY